MYKTTIIDGEEFLLAETPNDNNTLLIAISKLGAEILPGTMDYVYETWDDYVIKERKNQKIQLYCINNYNNIFFTGQIYFLNKTSWSNYWVDEEERWYSDEIVKQIFITLKELRNKKLKYILNK